MSGVDRMAGVLDGHRIIPVYTPGSAEEAVQVSRALLRGGIGAIEVTLRTPVALDAIAAVSRAVPRMVVGAGTVLLPAQLDEAQCAGARFAVSPGSSPELLEAGRASDLLYLPGVATASDVMAAFNAGYRLLKLFPAMAINALALLSAWRGPFPQVMFCPTGGIDEAQAPAFLRAPNVACLGGSWLTPPGSIAGGHWLHIEALARQAAMLANRPAGVGAGA